MGFRTSSAIAALLVSLAAPSGLALAQYYPPAPIYPPPYRPLPPVAVEDDTLYADPPIVQGRPLPPPVFGQQFDEPAPGSRFGRRGRTNVEEAELPPPGAPGAIAREVPPNLQPVEPGERAVRPYNSIPPVVAAPPAYGPPPGYGAPAPAPASPAYGAAPSAPPPGAQVPQGYEPAAAGSRPYVPG